MKHLNSKTYYLLVAFIIILMFNIRYVPQAFAEGEGGFSDSSASAADNTTWMSSIPDNKLVSELSIPGTHDSMAFHAQYIFDKKVVQTQSLPLNLQLKSGIRYLDIRVKPNGDTFDIYHGSIYQKASLDDVMNIATNFLTNNPSETILMRIKDENDKPSPRFEEIFTKYWNKYQNYFWQANTNNPRLGDIRGKIVIFQNFSSTRNFGIQYNSLDIQDDFEKTDGNKYYAVEAQLKKANNDTSKIYLNHFSTNGIHDFETYIRDDLTPKAQAKYINSQFWVYMQLDKFNIKHTGIIAADFPSSGTVSNTIPSNVGLVDVIISKNIR
ncbi:hypothetical protein BM74_15505 [Bacillus thuringiensis]|uniref:1-phosphatidylinositol phosphodiesterase n=1 Tax=Bacillus thuringiensis TaxID=1428 RepID=A0A437SIT2_BACTU|nr:phosphatidylinositol-specific phospholipase C [Bacillus thuringiensis]RVU63359.1 hypothetical protein BM74_15505 [Bacillus thuringiensis]